GHDVAELGARADGAAVGPAVEDQPAADARAQREHHHVSRSATGAVGPFRERGGIRVVVDPDRKPEAVAHPGAQVEVGERDVYGDHGLPGSLVDRRGESEADRGDAVVEHLADGLLDTAQELVLRFERRRRLAPALAVLFLLVVVWVVASYLSFRGGVAKANHRVSARTKAALTPQDGLLLSHATDILLLGTDHSSSSSRASDRHSDSIMLVRTDPS